MGLFAVIFYFLSALILISTLLAITRRQSVHAVLYLIVAFLGQPRSFIYSERRSSLPLW